MEKLACYTSIIFQFLISLHCTYDKTNITFCCKFFPLSSLITEARNSEAYPFYIIFRILYMAQLVHFA